MANTTYKSSIKPQFSGVQAQDVSYDLSQPKQMLGEIAKGVEQEAKTLQNIAQDESQINFNRGAAELVEKYGTDYKGLNDALLKLEQGSYDDFRKHNPELAEDLLRQQDAVRLRAVETARKQYVKVNNNKIKTSSGMLLDSFKMAMPDDFANYLYQKNLPEEEQDINFIAQWENNIQQIDQLLNRRDMEGNYIFSETDRKNRANVNKYKMQGAKTFVDGMESDMLKKWDENTFQNEKAFREMTGFDKDEYNQLDTYIKNRRKALDKEDERIIKTQAMWNTADLLKNGNDEAKIEELRKNANAPKDLIKRIVKLNDEKIKTHWYNPDKDTDPTGMLEAITAIGEVVNDPDTSPYGLEKKIAKVIIAEERLLGKSKEYNMSDKDIDSTTQWLAESLTNAGFAKNIEMLDDTNFIKTLKENNDKDLSIALRDTPSFITSNRIHKRAYNNAAQSIKEIYDYLKDGGDVYSGRVMLDKAKYNYIKEYNADWIPGVDFDRLEEQRKSGKPALYYQNGWIFEYKGYQTDGAIFEVKLH